MTQQTSSCFSDDRIGTMIKKLFDNLKLAVARGDMERCSAIPIESINVDTRFQKTNDISLVAPGYCV